MLVGEPVWATILLLWWTQTLCRGLAQSSCFRPVLLTAVTQAVTVSVTHRPLFANANLHSGLVFATVSLMMHCGNVLCSTVLLWAVR